MPSNPPRKVPDFVIGGLTPLTSTDFPGCLAAVVFAQGCPWRCGYCHNPHLIPVKDASSIPWDGVKDFLVRRRGLLDGVVFSGGEPTLQVGITNAVREVREMGFKVGLHTGGGYPARFREILPLMDWVGMDIKTGFESYSEITGRDGSGEKALESAKMLLKSGIFHEFRTTIHPLRHSKALLLQLAKDLAGLGAKSWVLQEFRAQGCAEESLRRGAVPLALDSEFLTEVHSLFENFQVRRA